MDDTHDDPAPSETPDDEALVAVDPADAPPLAERIADALQSELDADEGRAP